MQGHTHVLFGVTTMAAVNSAAIAVNSAGFIQPHHVKGLPAGVILCTSAAIIGALLPDIDANQSTIKKGMGAVGNALSWGMRLLGVKHRGLTHRGITMLIVMLVGCVVGDAFGYLDVGIAFALGYFSHVALADAMTIAGVPLLWPRKKTFHLLPGPLRVRTGGPVEQIVFLVVAIGLAYLLPDLIPDEAIKMFKSYIK